MKMVDVTEFLMSKEFLERFSFNIAQIAGATTLCNIANTAHGISWFEHLVLWIAAVGLFAISFMYGIRHVFWDFLEENIGPEIRQKGWCFSKVAAHIVVVSIYLILLYVAMEVVPYVVSRLPN